MFRVLKGEFSKSNFGLNFHKPQAFCEAQWRWLSPLFVVFRLLLSAYSMFSFIHLVYNSRNSRHNIMVFLTVWTYLLETLFFLLGAVLAVAHFWRPHYITGQTTEQTQTKHSSMNNPHSPNHVNDTANQNHESSKSKSMPINGQITNNSVDSDKTAAVPLKGGTSSSTVHNGTPGKSTQPRSSSVAPRGECLNDDAEAGRCGEACSGGGQCRGLAVCIKVYWVLSNISQVFPIIVSIIYFTALFKGKLIYDDLNVHAGNSIMLVLDLCVSARPVRLLHLLHPVVYGLTYVIFNTIYWSFDHERNVLYEYVLDWNHPGITAGVVAGLALVVIPLLQLANFAVHKLKLYIHCKVYGEQYY